MLKLPDRPIDKILGYPDDLKFRSSMTLFAGAAPDEPIFQAACVANFPVYCTSNLKNRVAPLVLIGTVTDAD